MTSNNENTKQFIIKHYIDSEIEPHFALLLKGEWGCGKTYFLDTILKEKYGKDYRKNSVIWLSLYGMSGISQIRKKLYELCHPFLTHKITKVVFDVVKTATKYSTGVDFNNDDSNDLTLDFSLPEIQNEDNNIKTKKLIVIDDLERCSIPIEEILGFFSEYILEQSIRAIFIGHADILNSAAPEFNSIKEKVIGFEFLIEPETEEAIQFFAKELKLESLESLMVSNCIEIVQLLNYGNLRVIRQAFYFLKQLLAIFTESEIKNNQPYFNSIIQFYFVLFFQKASDKLKPAEILDAIAVFKNNKMTLKKWKEANNKEVYNTFLLGSYPLQSLYEEILFEGKIDVTKIKADFLNWTKPVKEKAAHIQLLQSLFRINDDKEFKQLYKCAQKELKNKELHSYGDILSYFAMELSLKWNGIIETGINELKNKIFNYITRNRINLIPDTTFDIFDIHSFNKPEYIKAFQEVTEFLKSESRKASNNNLNKKLSRLIKELPDSFERISSIIKIANSDNYEYDEYPILSNLPVTAFYKAIKKLPYDKQLILFYNFNERYGKYYSNGTLKMEYYPDIPFVLELSEKYKKDTGPTIMSIENVHKKTLSEQYEALYKWMEDQKQMTS